MTIKTFRGLIASGTGAADGVGHDTISLHTNDGATGYRIVKFEVINNIPGTLDHKNVVKIYKVPQTGAADGVVDFSDPTLAGAALKSGDATSNNYPENIVVIFDSEIFNQDIYLTNIDTSGNNALMNYYIELEVIKLDLNENTVATLKDIRNITAPT